MHMKKFSFTITALMFVVAVHAQIFNVHKKNGEIVKFNISEVNFMDFSSEELQGDSVVPITPDITPIHFNVSNSNIDEFHVFGYFTATWNYNSAALPNLFNNQQVKKVDGLWKYEPIKYWPTITEGKPLSSFFAYAYSKQIEEVILRSERNLITPPVTASEDMDAGDPYVEYSTDLDPKTQKDLCWGVAKNNQLPMIDVERPAMGESLNFDFKHALASLNIKISLLVNNSSSLLSGGTHIWVRSVTLEGVAVQGALNLNSTAIEGPRWQDASNTASPIENSKINICDGRADGREALESATNEQFVVLNKKLIQNQPYGSADIMPGVTTAVVNLFESEDSNAPVYVIPTGESFALTICYEIETPDEGSSSLLSDRKTHGYTVENRITKVLLSNGLEAGKKYVIDLKANLVAVDGSVEISDWNLERVTR